MFRKLKRHLFKSDGEENLESAGGHQKFGLDDRIGQTDAPELEVGRISDHVSDQLDQDLRGRLGHLLRVVQQQRHDGRVGFADLRLPVLKGISNRPVDIHTSVAKKVLTKKSAKLLTYDLF